MSLSDNDDIGVNDRSPEVFSAAKVTSMLLFVILSGEEILARGPESVCDILLADDSFLVVASSIVRR